MRPASVQSTPHTLRCAIYTRVSSDAGLEQEFNSLDNQREAAEAYVRSQAHEGWRLLPARYDDGGYSGGTMERPGLQALLADLQARRIDVVVVYKVDRLTRSLADFAKLVELFDAHGVSFVSVTQSFNTTSSMGRLTLNVLLSFAQFEREVTGERIRDKIAASKRKGLWMGGVVPLGYRVQDRKLLVEESEAQTVRLIFERYLALGSTTQLVRELRDSQIATRLTIRPNGERSGRNPFTVGPLRHLLGNRVYLGEINHKGRSYPGEHAALISPEVFDAVQARLAQNRRDGGGLRARSEAFLQGRLFASSGERLTPTHARKGGVRYRYYVLRSVLTGDRPQPGAVRRLPAIELETAVRQALHLPTEDSSSEVSQQIGRVIVHAGHLEIHRGETPDHVGEPILVPWTPPSHTRRRSITAPGERASRWAERKLIRAEARARLLIAIAKARRWVERVVDGDAGEIARIAREEGCSERSVRMLLSLAFLSPTIVQAAVRGTLPHRSGLSSLLDLSPSWTTQERGATLG
jgi:site-specific DNA recombinase